MSQARITSQVRKVGLPPLFRKSVARETAQLVRVDDDVDAANLILRDVEREDVEQATVQISYQTGLAVDFRRAHGKSAGRGLFHEAREEARHAVCARDGFARRIDLPAAVR